METWFLVLVSLSISALLKIIFNHFFATKKPTNNLPPGPPTLPFIGNFPWFFMTAFDLKPILRFLHAKFGPIITLYIGSRPIIFIADHTLSHQTLIRKGTVYADRPVFIKAGLSNRLHVATSLYGPTWRLLRRNLTGEILHPSRVKSFACERNWVLQILQNQLESRGKSGHPVFVMEHFRYAMFCLLVFMCFGDKLDENQIKKIEEVQRECILNSRNFNTLNLWPRVTMILFHKRWKKVFYECQEDVLIPLIRARKKAMEERINKQHDDDEYLLSYVDTLLTLQLPEEKRNLEEGEMVGLCSEFLDASADTTSTVFQWIMANLVKHPQIQEKLFMEIKDVVEGQQEEVKEEDLQKLPYLKAIILEALRRHPPIHFLLPHAVTEDVMLDKYVIPKDGIVNFMLAEMGCDPNIWEDPMAFKPERFLKNGGETFDVTGSREMKMMPFGLGRRMCPGYGLAMLLLEYFVANLIWKFEWKAVDGEGVGLSEKEEFLVVMKNPLQAKIYSRMGK